MTNSAKPEFRRMGGGYQLVWPADSLAILADHIMQDRGTITAEVLIRSLSPGVPNHIGRTRLNLLSSSAKSRLAGDLSSQTGDIGLNWTAIIEQLSHYVIEAVRAGEPFQQLGDIPETGRPPWRLYPLVREGSPTLLYGDGETCKSTVALVAAIAIVTGLDIAGLRPIQGNVVYLDWEMDGLDHQTRLKELAAGLGLPELPRGIFHRRCFVPLEDQFDSVSRFIDEHDAVATIIDSYGLAAGERQNAGDTARAYFGLLRQLHCASMTVDHISLASRAIKGERRPIDTSAKYNLSRLCLEARKVAEASEHTAHVGLYHTKFNMGERLRPLGFALRYSDGRIDFRREDMMDVPELAEGASLTDQVVALLRGGAQTVAALGMMLPEAKEESIRKALNRGKDTLFINVLGKWGNRANE